MGCEEIFKQHNKNISEDNDLLHLKAKRALGNSTHFALSTKSRDKVNWAQVDRTTDNLTSEMITLQVRFMNIALLNNLRKHPLLNIYIYFFFIIKVAENVVGRRSSCLIK